MTFFQDLTRYEYSANEPNTLNVGWLSRRHAFALGETSKEFQERLFAFCRDEHVIHLTLGFHKCEFCSMSSEAWIKPRHGEKAQTASIGNGEIRVIGKSVIYAAPALIYHYVVAHHYRPPQEFIEAILAGPAPGSKQHTELLERLDAYSAILNPHG